MTNNITSRIESTFREVFNDPDLIISREMAASDIEAWDSLNHIRLIVALEMELEITFDTDQVAELMNVGELISHIESKLSISN
jgi:acyl carrier protein|tara:strand:- start:105 stop:353 length:249 start_codon:yes stop_codon:yes gene_type:complete